MMYALVRRYYACYIWMSRFLNVCPCLRVESPHPSCRNMYLWTISTSVLQAMRYTDVISQYHHPGYPPPTSSTSSSFLCASHAKVLQQMVNYFSSLASSRLCLIGSGSSGSNSCRHVEWTLQKYYEAAAVGCVIAGDIPSDPHLAPFVPLRLAGLDAPSIARRVARAVTKHSLGQFHSLLQASKEYVRTERNCRHVMNQYYLPALRDYLKNRKGGVYSDRTERILTSNTECSPSSNFNDDNDDFLEPGGMQQEGGEGKKEVETLWTMQVFLAAPQDSGAMPEVTATVVARHRDALSPEQQVWSFCNIYQIIDSHCFMLVRAMQGALGREGIPLRE